MNEFLLLALVVIYLAISYKPSKDTDRNRHSFRNQATTPVPAASHPAAHRRDDRNADPR